MRSREGIWIKNSSKVVGASSSKIYSNPEVVIVKPWSRVLQLLSATRTQILEQDAPATFLAAVCFSSAMGSIAFFLRRRIPPPRGRWSASPLQANASPARGHHR